MPRTNTADPQWLGLMMLMSRVIEQVLLARTTAPSDAADLLARLKADVDSDIDRLQLPNASDEQANDFKESAKTAVGFAFARVGFQTNA